MAWIFSRRFRGSAQGNRRANRRTKTLSRVALRSDPLEQRLLLSVADHDFGHVPLAFEANQGQTDAQVQFLARGGGYRAFLTPTEFVLALEGPSASVQPSAETDSSGVEPAVPVIAAPAAPTLVRMQLQGGNSSAIGSAVAPLGGTSSYYLGNDPAEWVVGVPHHARVQYTEVYPGIDLTYYGNQDQLQYDFVVNPGSDPSQISYQLVGVSGLAIDAQGNLLAETNGGILTQHRPVIYQDIGGSRQEVSSGYVLDGSGEVSFEVGAYDPTAPLIIDPVVSFSTYLGSTGDDRGQSIAVDATGATYIAGMTSSTALTAFGFPASTGVFDTSGNGSYDVFVTKLDPAGNAIVYSTFIGGSGNDQGLGIALGPGGTAYVTGLTSSTNFPLQGAAQTSNAGGFDAFVVKLNSTGTAPLEFSTYQGGSGDDRGHAIAVDAAGNAHVTGITTSSNLSLGTLTALQPGFGGGAWDAWTGRFSATGARDYVSYLGGSGDDRGQAITVDTDGNAYAVGFSNSTGLGTAGVVQPALSGSYDAYIAKINHPAVGNPSSAYFTYLGGSGYEEGHGIALDGDENIYLTGLTQSTNFPVRNGFQANQAGGNDAFVAKLLPAANALVYSTYLGGGGDDRGWEIAVDAAGHAHVTGITSSADFPTASPLVDDATIGNTPQITFDAFVAKLTTAGSALMYSTYLGGNGDDEGFGIAVDGDGAAYVTGFTTSTNMTTSASPLQVSFGGNIDGFVTKLIDDADHPPVVAALGDRSVIGSLNGLSPLQFHVLATDPDGPTGIGTVPAVAIPALTQGNQAYGGSLGLDFDVLADIAVSELGVFDDGSDGLKTQITARLYERSADGTTGTLLSTIVFAAGTGPESGELRGGSRFLGLPFGPIGLQAGHHYTIVAEGYNGVERNGNGNFFGSTVGFGELNTGGGHVAYVGARFGNLGQFPTSVQAQVPNTFAAGTFTFEGVSASTVTFTLDPDDTPPGATIDPNTGFFSWSPPPTQIPYAESATVHVSDADGNVVTKTFSIIVDLPPVAPTLPPLAGESALRFDGVDDYVSVPNDVGLHSDRQLTVTGWFNTANMTNEYQNIFYKANEPAGSDINSSNREYALWVHRDGLLHFSSTSVARIGVGQYFVNSAAAVIQPNQWHHFAAVVNSDAGYMRIYVDGVLSAQAAYDASGIRTSNAPLRFGYGSYLNGWLDDIRLYNVERNEDQIRLDMNRIVEPSSDLVGYWRFDEAGGNLAVDSSGNEHNGTLGGGVAAQVPTRELSGAYLFDDDPDPVIITVTNTADSGPGSLRQAIIEANALDAGYPLTIGFDIPQLDPNFDEVTGVYTISPVTALPVITRPNVTIAGHTQTLNGGDTNSGMLGLGGNVGVDLLPISQVAAPEVQIVDGDNVSIGLHIAASHTTVSGLAIYGFGTSANHSNHATIRLAANFTGTIIEGNVLGASATSFSDPDAGLPFGSGGTNVWSEGADFGILRNNLIGFAGGNGVVLNSTSNQWRITGNEIRGNAGEATFADGIFIFSGNDTLVSGNRIMGNQGSGLDVRTLRNVIENNSIGSNGAILTSGVSSDTAGIELAGAAANTIDRNLIADNYGAGVFVFNTAHANTITRNTIFNNGETSTPNGGRSGQLGIDLANLSETTFRGVLPYVTPNDVFDPDLGGNSLVNAPVLTSARIQDGELEVTGFAPAARAVYLGSPVLGTTTGAIVNDGDGAITMGATNGEALMATPFDFPTQEVSVELWVRSNDATSAGTPFSYAASNSENNEFLIFDYRNLQLYVNNASVTTGVAVNDGLWHHIVVTWQNSDGAIRLYVDSVEEFSGTLQAGVTLDSRGAVVLGQDQDSVGGGFQSTQKFIGSLDEVAIYGSVLDPAEVLDHYERGTNPLVGGYAQQVVLEGPVAYWRLGDTDLAQPATNLGQVDHATIEVFIANPDASGFGEGQNFVFSMDEGSLDDEDETSDSYSISRVGSDTNAPRFTFRVPVGISIPAIADGMVLTATATLNGSTSEFSKQVEVKSFNPDTSAFNAAPETIDVDLTSAVDEGGLATLTVTYQDDDLLDGHTATIDWDDGTITTVDLTGPQTLFSPPTLFDDPNTPETDTHTYYVSRGFMTWYAAAAEAQRLGGHLVAINSAAENAFVTTLILEDTGANTATWIGLSDFEEEGVWTRWTSGEPVTYRNFQAAEPNNASIADHAWINYTAAGLWDDTQGYALFRAVIEVPTMDENQRTFTVTHQYRDGDVVGPDTRNVHVTLVDNDLTPGMDDADASVDVNNVAPRLEMAYGPLLSIANPLPGAGDTFGTAVAALGNNILVGAPSDDTAGLNSGAVYLFDGVTGALLLTILNPAPGDGDNFGFSIAAVGGNILVGAPNDDPDGLADSGSAYLFDGATGTLLTTFVNPTPNTSDNFGRAVAAFGTDVLISAYLDDANGTNGNATGDNAGAVYLFTPAGGLITTILRPQVGNTIQFGHSLTVVGGNNLLVGAPNDDTIATNAGGAYLYEFDDVDNTFNFLRAFYSPFPGHSGTDNVGFSVAAYGNLAVISARGEDLPGTNFGAAMLVDTETGDLIRYFQNPAPAGSTNFANFVAVVGDKVLISAQFEDAGAVVDAGAAYLFDIATGDLVAQFVNPAPGANDQFGGAVAGVGNRLLIGAPADDAVGAADAGFVYVYAPQSGVHVDSGPVSVGGAVDISGTIVDPGHFDTHTVQVDWGDGAIEILDEVPALADDATVPLSQPVHFQGHTYYAILNSNLTWAQAEAQAQLAGGHLVAISDTAENQFLVELIRQIYAGDVQAWIGFNDEGQEGTFVWASGDPITYTNWSGGQPDNFGAGEDMTGINFGGVGRWNDHPDSTILTAAIIEIDGRRSFPASHTFIEDGERTITISVTDDDGGTVVAATSVEVVIEVAMAVLETDPDNAALTALVVRGTSAADLISVTPVAAGQFQVVVNGESLGVFEPTGQVIVRGQGGNDTLVVQGTAGADTIVILADHLTLIGQRIALSGVENLTVNALAGADAVSMAGIDPAIPVTVIGGADADSFSGSFAALSGTLSLEQFEIVDVTVSGNLDGSLAVQAPGVLNSLAVGGTVALSSLITAGNVSNVAIGTLAGVMTVVNLHTAAFSVISGNLTITGTGTDVSVGTLLAGATLVAGSLLSFSAMTVGGTITADHAENMNVGVLEATGVIEITGEATGIGINIGDMEPGSQVDIENLIGFTSNNVGGTLTSGHAENVDIETLEGTGVVEVTGDATLINCNILVTQPGSALIVVNAVNLEVGTVGGAINVVELHGIGIFSTIQPTGSLTVETAENLTSVSVEGEIQILETVLNLVAQLVTGQIDAGTIVQGDIGDMLGVLSTGSAGVLSIDAIVGSLTIIDTVEELNAETVSGLIDLGTAAAVNLGTLIAGAIFQAEVIDSLTAEVVAAPIVVTVALGTVDVETVTGAGEIDAPPLTFAAFDVQKGAVQRSYLRYMDVTFNQGFGLLDMIASVNDASTTNDRIKIWKYNLNGNGPAAPVSVASRVSAIDEVLAFNFGAAGITGNASSNAGDGYYRMELDINGDGDFGDAGEVLTFYRLMGDVNGDRIVNNLDLAAINAVFGTYGSNLNADVNGDGVVDQRDRALWNVNRNRFLNPALFLSPS